MLLKTGLVIIRTELFVSPNGEKTPSKVIWRGNACDIHTLPSVGDYVFAPNKDECDEDLRVTGIYHDLFDSVSTIAVDPDLNGLYADLTSSD